MRLIFLVLVAFGLICVAAAQPSAAPVTLSFSYEHAAYQPTAAAQHDDGAAQQQHAIAAAATDDAAPRSHLAPPLVTTHPLSTSHSQQLTVNDTDVPVLNSSSHAVHTTAGGAAGRNTTKDGSGTMEKDVAMKATGDRAGNATDMNKTGTETRGEAEKEKAESEGKDEKKEGEKETSFPDDAPAPHNITHGNQTHHNRSSNAGYVRAALSASAAIAPLLAMVTLHW